MFKKFILPLALLVVVGYAGLSWFQLKSSHVADLILCSVDKGGIYIPDSVCYWYLTNYRSKGEDIRQLSESGGVGFILGVYHSSEQGENSAKITLQNQRVLEIAGYFLDIGIDINKIDDIDGLTPLHKEVMANNPKLVKYLLDKGADLSIREKNGDLTPLEFAELLAAKNAGIDRSEVLSILRK